MSYGGLTISLFDLYLMDYGDIYELLIMMDKQKKHEEQEKKNLKPKK